MQAVRLAEQYSSFNKHNTIRESENDDDTIKEGQLSTLIQ